MSENEPYQMRKFVMKFSQLIRWGIGTGRDTLLEYNVNFRNRLRYGRKFNIL